MGISVEDDLQQAELICRVGAQGGFHLASRASADVPAVDFHPEVTHSAR
jgi:hypothetical protein